MLKILKRFNQVYDRVINLLAVFAAALLVFLTVSINYDVIARQISGQATVWIYEINDAAIMAYVTFFGAAWVLKNEGHVVMDLVTNQLKRKPQALLNAVTSVIGAVLCFIIFWYGAEVTWQAYSTEYRRVSLLNPILWPMLMAIPIGSLLMFIQFIRRAHGFWMRR